MAEKKQTKKKGTKKKVHKKNRRLKNIVLGILIIILLGIIGVSVRLGTTLIQMKKEAIDIVCTVTRDTFKANQTTLVYDTNGDMITKLKGEKDVYYLDYSEIPQEFVDAIVSVEDVRFYKHHGIDLKGIARAAFINLKSGGTREGASTITQQLARGTFLSNEVTWNRKIKEMFIALELEKIYSKQDIMEFYLNNIYYSNGYYGIQAASKGYFDEDVSELSLSKIAYLSAIPNGPNLYNPYTNPENTIKRRNKILKDMLEEGFINKDEYQKAISEKIVVKKKKVLEKHNYVETYIIHCATKALMEQSGFEFKSSFKNDAERNAYKDEYDKQYATVKHTLFISGYRIYTSIDFDKQEELQKAVDNKLAAYTEKANDIYKVQGAATCIDNKTGKVVAIVGGRSQDNLNGYTLNRAYQSARQPGSSLKPLVVYAPILERGYTPGSTVNDGPMSASDPHKVKNSGGSYRGKISLRSAVMKSSNVATMRLYESLTPKVALKYLEKMGFTHLVDADYKYYTTCLGGMTYGVTTEEMAGGYATLANNGEYREPTCIQEITSSDGVLIKSVSNTGKRVFTKSAANMMTDVLKSVVTGGTGVGTKVDRFDTAGKTGTTTSLKDGWFCGYTPYYTTAVWVGRDDNVSMSALHGNTYPAYIFKAFMSDIHKELDSKENFNNYEGGGSTAATTGTTASTTEASTTEASTTEAPTTAAPTTEAPTTEAPTTEAPTTAAPTTESPSDETE